jgi:hypothetical protein
MSRERKIGRFLGVPLFTMLVVLISLPVSASATPPQVISTSVSHVGTTSARLQASVNPEGKVISYRFEYGASACSAEPDLCATNPELEGVLTGNASEPKLIAATLKGLASGTTYHFRIKVSNPAKETAQGGDATFATFRAPVGFGSCPNEALRTGKASSLLPDCRAYEQASSPDKNGADINGSTNQVEASADGNGLAFFTASGLPGAVGAQDFETFLAQRKGDNWATHGVYPPASQGPVVRNAGWTPDLSLFFSNVTDSFAGPWLFQSRNSASEAFIPIFKGGESFLAGASADGSLVYLQNEAQLLPEAAPGKDNLYVWDRDTHTLKLAGVLADSECATPPCVPAGGSFAGAYQWLSGENSFNVNRSGFKYYVQPSHAISEDGSRAYFTAGGGQLYLREGAAGSSPKTVHVSAPQRSAPDTNGTRAAAFMAATPDGSKAFFTSGEKLTEDATTGPEPPPAAIARAGVDGKPDSIEANCLPARAAGLATDSKYIYWANPGAGSIGRAELGCGSIDNEFILTGDQPQWVAVDAGHIYWTSSSDAEGGGEGEIGRADIDGVPASIESDFIPGKVETGPGEFKTLVNHPQGIAVDATHVYWANDDLATAATYAIARAEIDGSNPEPSWHPIGSLEIPQGVAVNATHVYWTTNNPNSWIARADLDGSNELFKSVNLEGFVPAEVRGIALDGSHVYWVGKATSQIGRANLELGEIEMEFIKPSGSLRGLAVDPTHIYWGVNGEAVPNPGNDLYQFDAETGDLSDLVPDTEDPNGAEVKGILGTSIDGSYVYFAANGDLDGAGPAKAGDCEARGGGFLNAAGHCGLYLTHAGQVSLIAPLDADGGESDATNWEPGGQLATRSAVVNTARVSGDGKTLLFRSQEQLTKYDNRGLAEFYRFNTEEGLSCVSCSPSGEAPLAAPSFQSIEPALPLVEPPGSPAILTRNLSSDGKRVFFETPDKLVAGDTNGEEGCPPTGQAFVPACQDVYEWEAKGTGSCNSSAQNGGCLYLLSSGTSAEPAFFADASESGNDAFTFTRSALVPQDQDTLQDAYDAHVEGGLASQNVVPPPPCEGDACKPGASAPPPFQSPQTPGFQGPSNPKEKGCPKGKRKVTQKGKSRCVAKKKKKHKGASKKKGTQKASKSGGAAR